MPCGGKNDAYQSQRRGSPHHDPRSVALWRKRESTPTHKGEVIVDLGDHGDGCALESFHRRSRQGLVADCGWYRERRAAKLRIVGWVPAPTPAPRGRRTRFSGLPRMADTRRKD